MNSGPHTCKASALQIGLSPQLWKTKLLPVVFPSMMSENSRTPCFLCSPSTCCCHCYGHPNGACVSWRSLPLGLSPECPDSPSAVLLPSPVLILVMSLLALNFNCLLTLSPPPGCEPVGEGPKIFPVAAPTLTQCLTQLFWSPFFFSLDVRGAYRSGLHRLHFTSVLELWKDSVLQPHASADAFLSGSGNRMARLCA